MMWRAVNINGGIVMLIGMLMSGCIDPVSKKASLGQVDLSLKSATLESTFLWPEQFSTMGVVFNHPKTNETGVVTNPYSPLTLMLDIRETATGRSMVTKMVADPLLPWAYYAPPSLAVLFDWQECKLQVGVSYTVKIVVVNEAEKLGIGEVFIWWQEPWKWWKPYNEFGELKKNGIRSNNSSDGK